MDESSVRIIPLGGLNGIGKNITVFEYRRDIIVVDCGIMFPSDEMPGIDYLIPDFSYLQKHRSRVRGIVITHGHEDHIGAIPYLLKEVKAPIYATKLTLGLIRSRLEDSLAHKDYELVEVQPRDRKRIGHFSIEFIKVNHSIIGGVGLAITTDVGTIIHTGDFKIDFSPVDGDVTDIFRFADYGERGVLLLMSDSTNAEREGFTKSESVLVEKLAEIFSSATGRIIVATFASNIHRIQQVIETAQRYSRKVAVSGHTMLKNIEIARGLGYLNFKKDILIDISKVNSLPAKKAVIIGTGSQGEPMSALYRMAYGNHRHIRAEKGDTVVITASVIPGNERTVANVVNSLMRMGAEVYYDQDEDIHVSGHGSTKELKLMIAVTKPKFFMPIHGEYRHLKAHAGIAESLGIKPSRIMIAENGDILELTQKSFRKIGAVDLSQIYVDGREIGDIESSVIKDRHQMSNDGIVAVVVFLSQRKQVRPPVIIMRGVIGGMEERIAEELRADIAEWIEKSLTKKTPREEAEEILKKRLESRLFRTRKVSPLVVVTILEG